MTSSSTKFFCRRPTPLEQYIRDVNRANKGHKLRPRPEGKSQSSATNARNNKPCGRHNMLPTPASDDLNSHPQLSA